MKNKYIKVLGTALNLRIVGEKSSYLNTPISKDYCAVDILTENLNNKAKLFPYNLGVFTTVDKEGEITYREKIGIRPVIYHIDKDNYYLSFVNQNNNGYKIEYTDSRISDESDYEYSFLNGIVINAKNLKVDQPISFKFIIKGVPQYDEAGNLLRAIDLEAKLAFNLCECMENENEPDVILFVNDISDKLLETAAKFEQKTSERGLN